MYKLLSETTCRQHMKWSPFSYPFTHTPSLTPNAHTHSHLHPALRLSSTSNSWSYNNFLTSTSGPVQSSTLYTTLVCNSLINTHNLSQTQSEVSGRRGLVEQLAAPTLTVALSTRPSLLITLTPPSLSSSNFPTHYKTFLSPNTLPTCPSGTLSSSNSLSPV